MRRAPRLVIAPELAHERLASRCERRSPVRRVQLASHETVGDECVHEPGHRSRRHLQCIGEDTLGHGTALAQLPEEVRTGRREPESLDRVGHVVVQHDHELEDAFEEILILLYLVYSEGW